MLDFIFIFLMLDAEKKSNEYYKFTLFFSILSALLKGESLDCIKKSNLFFGRKLGRGKYQRWI